MEDTENETAVGVGGRGGKKTSLSSDRKDDGGLLPLSPSCCCNAIELSVILANSIPEYPGKEVVLGGKEGACLSLLLPSPCTWPSGPPAATSRTARPRGV